MNRGWMVAGVLALVAAPAVPAAAAGVAMVLERVEDPAGMLKWIRTGDVLRYEVRLNGMARDARLAVAATPVHSLTELSCAHALPSRSSDTPDPGGAEITARALAGRALAGVAVPGAQACKLGRVSAEEAVQVVLSVPPGAEQVEVAAVARLREEGGGLTTITRTAATPVLAADVHTPASPEASDTVGPSGGPVRTDERGQAVPEIDRRSRLEQGEHRGSCGSAEERAERDTGDRDHRGTRVGEDARDRGAGRAGKSTCARERDRRELRAGERGAQEANRREAGQIGRREPGEVARREPGRSADEGAVKPGEEGRDRRGVRGVEGDHGRRGVRGIQGERDRPGVRAGDGAVEPERDRGGFAAREQAGASGERRRGRAEPGEGRGPWDEREAEGIGADDGLTRRAHPGEGRPLIPERVHQGDEVELPVVAPPLPEEAPLPRVVDGAPVRVRAEEPINPLAGPDGLPYAAGGIGVLLAGLWAVAHAQTRRKRRKVF